MVEIVSESQYGTSNRVSLAFNLTCGASIQSEASYGDFSIPIGINGKWSRVEENANEMNVSQRPCHSIDLKVFK